MKINQAAQEAQEALVRIRKALCRCGTCKFFVQHYGKEGNLLDFGHCRKNNHISPKKPYECSCSFWELDGKEDWE